MKKARIAVLVSGGGTNLQALIDAQKDGKLGQGEIALVLASKPDVFAEKILVHFGLIKHFDFIAGALLDGSRINKDDVIAHALGSCDLFDKTDRILSKLFRVGMLAATMAFIFIHTLCVNMPLIMQGIAPYVSVEKAAEITNSIMMLNIVPTVAYFLAADGVLTVVMVILVWRRTLPLNRFALLCNPLFAAGVGMILGMLPRY